MVLEGSLSALLRPSYSLAGDESSAKVEPSTASPAEMLLYVAWDTHLFGQSCNRWQRVAVCKSVSLFADAHGCVPAANAVRVSSRVSLITSAGIRSSIPWLGRTEAFTSAALAAELTQ